MESVSKDVPTTGQVVLRPPQAANYLGIPQGTLYDWVRRGLAPKPIKLGPRASAWLKSELDSFLAQRVAERDQETEKEEAA